ncbi:MAG: VacJ family lipoprotein [Hyphomicrobiales bacterium]|nr:VacJ family lipoprotein [Hyphomicrobiales bacterium]
MARKILLLALCAGGCAGRFDLHHGVCPRPATSADAESVQQDVGVLPIDVPAGEEGLRALISVDDPWQETNRSIYAFNWAFDEYIFLPVVDTYIDVVPEVLRDRVHDFFSNIGELFTFANLLLQARLGPAGETAFRFGVNTGLGFFGFVDVASDGGMPKYQEDFGQTLGCWGVGTGPYMVLPVLGPSNARDTSAALVDRAAYWIVDPLRFFPIEDSDIAFTSGEVVDTRANIDFRYHETGSPFEYEYVRLLYTTKRLADLRR